MDLWHGDDDWKIYKYTVLFWLQYKTWRSATENTVDKKKRMSKKEMHHTDTQRIGVQIYTELDRIADIGWHQRDVIRLLQHQFSDSQTSWPYSSTRSKGTLVVNSLAESWHGGTRVCLPSVVGLHCFWPCSSRVSLYNW